MWTRCRGWSFWPSSSSFLTRLGIWNASTHTMCRWSRLISRGCTASSPRRGIVFNHLRLGLKRLQETMMVLGDGTGYSGWSRHCDHAAAVPAVRRVLGAFGSVLRQMVDIPVACRSWYARCILCSRPWRSHRYSSGDGCRRACYCAMTGALVGSRRKLWSFRSCSACGRRPVPGQGCCACWCNDWGRATWIHVQHHPGWLLEEFFDFLRDWVNSTPEVNSPSWPARRRQRQWHVPYWFCWY